MAEPIGPSYDKIIFSYNLKVSGVATGGGARGQSTTPDSEKIVKSG